jgi:hypothetical protein
MAKELGLQPKSLIKNIPSPPQKWKAPVRDWVRALYEEKIGSRKQAGGAPATQAVRNQVIEFRNPEHPWPDKPEIPELVLDDPFDSESDEDVDVAWDEYAFQDRFEPPSEENIDEENTRMLRRQCLYRWAAQSVAVTMSTLSGLKELKRAMSRGLSLVQDTPWGGVAHHQVNVHIFDCEVPVSLHDSARP